MQAFWSHRASLTRVIALTIASFSLICVWAVAAGAATIAKSASTLTYTGGSEANNVTVTVDSGGHLIVSDSGVSVPITTTGSGCSTTADATPTVDCGVPGAGLTGIVVNTADGADSVAFGDQIPLARLEANGGPGDDTLTGGDNAEILNGGADLDTLYGNGGADNLQGGTENDYIVAADGGTPDEVGCGAGPHDEVDAEHADTINQCEDDTSGTALDVAVAQTDPATDVTSSSATLHSFIDAHSDSTTARFQWGTTTSYGTFAGYDALGGGAWHLSYGLNGLQPQTTYHYRAIAIPNNSKPAVAGDDQVFVTAAPPLPPPPPTLDQVAGLVAAGQLPGFSAIQTPTLRARVTAASALTSCSFQIGEAGQGFSRTDPCRRQGTSQSTPAPFPAGQYYMIDQPNISPRDSLKVGTFYQFKVAVDDPNGHADAEERFLTPQDALRSGSCNYAPGSSSTTINSASLGFAVAPGHTHGSDPGSPAGTPIPATLSALYGKNGRKLAVRTHGISTSDKSAQVVFTHLSPGTKYTVGCYVDSDGGHFDPTGGWSFTTSTLSALAPIIVVHGGTAQILIACQAKAGCKGDVSLVAPATGASASKKKAKSKRKTIGRKSFKIRGRGRKVVRVALSPSARKQLRKRHRLRASEIVRVKVKHNGTAVTRKNVTLRGR